MLHLIFGQNALVPETRHVRAGIKGLSVIDLAPGVLHHGFAIATQLAVVVKRWAKGSMGNLFLADLVAVVAVAAIGCACLIAIRAATAVLGNTLTLLPVPQELAVCRIFNCSIFGLLQLTSSFARQRRLR